MIFIIKDNFKKQLENLSKKFKLINKDFEEFKENFSLKEGKNLGKGISNLEGKIHQSLFKKVDDSE